MQNTADKVLQKIEIDFLTERNWEFNILVHLVSSVSGYKQLSVVYLGGVFLFVFLFGGHTHQCSGVITSSELKVFLLSDSGDHITYQGFGA